MYTHVELQLGIIIKLSIYIHERLFGKYVFVIAQGDIERISRLFWEPFAEQ